MAKAVDMLKAFMNNETCNFFSISTYCFTTEKKKKKPSKRFVL